MLQGHFGGKGARKNKAVAKLCCMHISQPYPDRCHQLASQSFLNQVHLNLKVKIKVILSLVVGGLRGGGLIREL